VPRKRGAQPSNLNALKHGFYSRQFKPDERDDLETMLADGLTDEIAMLRVIIRRVMELADGVEMTQAINLLGALGMASTRLAGLLRTQRLLTGDSNTTAQAISDALADIVKDLKL